MRPDRRIFLAGAAATGLSALAPGSNATSTGAVRLRRSISGMAPNDPDVEAFRRAVSLMRKSGQWEQQVALHADFRNRMHSSWRFLPWHRLQLVRFEQLVARLSGKADFALPYWDWGRQPFPDLFFDDPVFRMRNRAWPRGLVLDSSWYTSKLDDPFDSYFGAPRDATPAPGGGPFYVSGSAEWSGHNLMHGYVGGDMNDLQRAPNDPIFWLHHANIDRAWTIWSQRNAAAVYPRAWSDEVLAGLVDADGKPAPAVTAGDAAHTLPFGYTYPADPSIPPVDAHPPEPSGLPWQRHSWAVRLLRPNIGVIDVPGRMSDRWPSRITGFIEMECDPHRSLMVSLAGTRNSDGAEIFHDTIFAIPMGTCAQTAAYRVNLDRLRAGTGSGGVQLRIEVSPMLGTRGRLPRNMLMQAAIDMDVAGPV